MRVTVTQVMIDTGKRGSCSGCPVAIAVSYATRCFDVKVSTCAIRTRTDIWCTPKAVARFINDFDARRTVYPFSFVLHG